MYHQQLLIVFFCLILGLLLPQQQQQQSTTDLLNLYPNNSNSLSPGPQHQQHSPQPTSAADHQQPSIIVQPPQKRPRMLESNWNT